MLVGGKRGMAAGVGDGMTTCRQCGEPNDRHPLTYCAACAEYKAIVRREGEHIRKRIGARPGAACGHRGCRVGAPCMEERAA